MLDQATAVPPGSRRDPILADAPHRIGAVALVVHDLPRVSAFYQDVIGLGVLREEAGRRVLGTGEAALIDLRENPAARRWSPREAGLFHTAFLLPSRADLGAWLRHMAEGRFSIAGASDHIVSEAVYLADPEGNGIEVYADRPSSSWRRVGGEIAMSTEALDLQGVMQTATAPWTGMPAGGRVGHVHLQSGDLTRAGAFYADMLGFEIMARYPGALFYGSGGYHHQLATNLWNSRGAGPRTDATTGLAEIELLVRGGDVLEAILARLTKAGVGYAADAGGLIVKDPWETTLRLMAAD